MIYCKEWDSYKLQVAPNWIWTAADHMRYSSRIWPRNKIKSKGVLKNHIHVKSNVINRQASQRKPHTKKKKKRG